jgi:acyl-CoA synthetase (AMP-forming)/AMP-acid ligase II
MCVVYLYIGATVVLMKKADPLEVLKLIHDEKITQSLIVPTLSNFILNLPEEEKSNRDLSSFRTLISATAPLLTKTKRDLLNFFKNTELYELYSASELGMVTTLRPEDQMRKTRCCGKPFIGVEIKLLDEEGKEVPIGEPGELYMKGFNTFKEYYKDQKNTENSRKGEWVSVGDIASMDDEGYYYIVDRKKDMVCSGGVCIYPSEIDDVIQQHPSVLEVAVIGVPDETWGESLKALVVLKSGEKTTEEEIIKFCKNKLSRFKIPRRIEFIPSLPKSASGKILKAELRSKHWKGHEVKV